MPKLDLRQIAKHEDLTLSDVPEGEWWLADCGTPYQRESDEECVFYHQTFKMFRVSSRTPSSIKVTRKLCDSIEMIWE